jgi:hypothetical protein
VHAHRTNAVAKKGTVMEKWANPKPPGWRQCEDPIVPLSKGGWDDPSNMQWLPRDQHRAKTKREQGK